MKLHQGANQCCSLLSQVDSHAQRSVCCRLGVNQCVQVQQRTSVNKRPEGSKSKATMSMLGVRLDCPW